MRFGIILLAFALSACATVQNRVETAAITPAKLSYPQFKSAASQSNEAIDHAAFDAFLENYLVKAASNNGPAQGASLVKYGDVTPADRAALTAYIDRLQATRVSALGRDEQLAFWINLYNAQTIRVILDAYPVGSIRSIKSSPLDFKGPWNDEGLVVEGAALTLDDIENRIVRPVFDDPRIHYALNCAAIGCPNLRGSAYRGEGLDTALDDQARAFINNPRGVRVDDGKVTASRIFLLYADDYGGGEDDILNHIRKYAGPELQDALKGITKISAYEYDWDLNDAK